MTALKTQTSLPCDLDDISKPVAILYDNLFDGHPGSKLLIDTLKNNDWEYVVVSIHDTYRGHKDKLLGYKAMLETLPADKVVVLTDSRDVVCCRNVKAFMEGFASLESNFIVSLEAFCNQTSDQVTGRDLQCVPLTTYWKHRNVTTWPVRKYVNSGLIAGKVANILEFFNYSIEKEFKDDQVAFGTFMNEYPEKVYGDQDATILHTTTFGKGGGLENCLLQKHDSPTFAELFGRAAFFLHVPGVTNKGQAVIYDFIKFCILNGASSKKLNTLYDIPEWTWYQRPPGKIQYLKN